MFKKLVCQWVKEMPGLVASGTYCTNNDAPNYAIFSSFLSLPPT